MLLAWSSEVAWEIVAATANARAIGKFISARTLMFWRDQHPNLYESSMWPWHDLLNCSFNPTMKQQLHTNYQTVTQQLTWKRSNASTQFYDWNLNKCYVDSSNLGIMNPDSSYHSLKGGIVNRKTVPFQFILWSFWTMIPESIPEKGQKQSRNRNCGSFGIGIDTALFHTV